MLQRKALVGFHWAIEMSSLIPVPVVLLCLGSVSQTLLTISGFEILSEDEKNWPGE